MSSSKSKSPTTDKQSAAVELSDEEEKWTDLSDKDATITPTPPPPSSEPKKPQRPSPPATYPPAIQPLSYAAEVGRYNSMMHASRIPPSGPLYPSLGSVPSPHIHSHPLPPAPAIPAVSEAQKLENELVSLAECKLGLLNAAFILQKEAHPEVLPTEPRRELLYCPNTPYANPHPSGCSIHYSSDRITCLSMVKDFGYLLGLERAIKILKAANIDRKRENVTYSFKVVSSPAPLPPAPAQLQPYPPAIVPPGGIDQAKELRKAAKEIVKESIKEYKKEVLDGVEEVQKEMIKLCRDVSIHAMNKH